jgi:hypothetical protein
MRTRRTVETVEPAQTTTPAPEASTTKPVVRSPWSPAQIVALIIGIGFVVLGFAALAKTGSSHLYTPRDVVWHLGHSPLLGWGEVAFGALLVITGVVPGGLRTLMGLLGAGSLALGIIIVVDAATYHLHRWLNVTHTNGWLYIACGAVLLLAALFSPVVSATRPVDVRQQAPVT